MSFMELIKTAKPICGDFHELRKKGIGGSDVAAILGQSKYSSPRQVWLQKTGRKPPFEGNWFTERGKKREAAIRAAAASYYEALTGIHLEIEDVTGISFESIAHPILRANLDGLVMHPTKGLGVLEIKTASSGTEWEDNMVPLAYWYQVQHYMIVTGLEYAIFAAEIDGYSGLEFRVVELDPEFAESWPSKARNFWQAVESDMDPGLDQDNVDGILEVYPQATTTELVAAMDMAPIVRDYKALGNQIKELETRQEALKAAIAARIGSSAGLFTGEATVTWSSGKRTSVDSKALEATYPEIVAQFKKETTFRTMRVKES